MNRKTTLRNYFPMPNEIFGLNLSVGEVALYSYLMHLENRKTHQCYPSFSTIGKALNISKNTVHKYVELLEQKCLIETQPTNIIDRNGMKRNGNLLFTILPIGEAVEHNISEQIKKNEQRVCEDRVRELLANSEIYISESTNTDDTDAEL